MQTLECQEHPLSTTVGGDRRQHHGQLSMQFQHLGERCSPSCYGHSVNYGSQYVPDTAQMAFCNVGKIELQEVKVPNH